MMAYIVAVANPISKGLHYLYVKISPASITKLSMNSRNPINKMINKFDAYRITKLSINSSNMHLQINN